MKIEELGELHDAEGHSWISRVPFLTHPVLRGDHDPNLRHHPARWHAVRRHLAFLRRISCASRSKLDELGVAFIEGGWPGSNPKDVEFFERARDMQWKNALIAAFGSTCRVKRRPRR